MKCMSNILNILNAFAAKKYVIVLICSIFMCHSISSSVFAEQITIDSDELFNLAFKCMEKKEYKKAQWELENFIHFFPNNSRVPEANYYIGCCLLKDNRNEEAIDFFYQIINTYPETKFAGKAMLAIGESYTRQGLLKEAEQYFFETEEKYPYLKNDSLYHLGWNSLEAGDWLGASSFFKSVEVESPLYGRSHQLADICIEGQNLPLKNPALAGYMAAFLPGSGHAYASRYKDAGVALLLNGLFTWAAVESFHNGNEVLGGMLSFLEIGWYAGNIYSALNVTHKYNRNIENSFRKKIKDQYDINRFGEDKGITGFSFGTRF